MKIVEKSQIWSNLSKNLDFGQSCRKVLILVKISKNVDFSPKIAKNVDFSQNYQNKIDFGQNFTKSGFWSQFIKNLAFS